MGSFNVSCALSGISIGPGDNAVFLPLFFSKYFDRALKDTAVFEHPFSPGKPVFGTYADYGRLEQEDGTEVDFESLPDGMSHCFIKREVWDLMVAPMPGEYGQMGTAALAGDVSAEVLVTMGFTEDGETGMDRYSRKFVRAGADAFVATDGTWSHIVTTTGDEYKSLYSPRTFADIWKIVTGQQIDLAELEKISAEELIVRSELVILRAEVDSWTDKVQVGPEDDFGLSRVRVAIQMARFAVYKFNERTGNELLVNSMVEGFWQSGDFVGLVACLSSHLTLLSELLTLQRNLRTLGLMLRPGVAGPQCGNAYAEHHYHSRMAEIAESQYRKKMKDADEE